MPFTTMIRHVEAFNINKKSKEGFAKTNQPVTTELARECAAVYPNFLCHIAEALGSLYAQLLSS